MNPGLCANEIGSRVQNDKTGEVYLQETARALRLALTVETSRLTLAFGNEHMYFSFDGVVENSGGNNDNRFGENSVLHYLRVYATRECWVPTRKMLDDCGVGGPFRHVLAQKESAMPNLTSPTDSLTGECR